MEESMSPNSPTTLAFDKWNMASSVTISGTKQNDSFEANCVSLEPVEDVPITGHMNLWNTNIYRQTKQTLQNIESETNVVKMEVVQGDWVLKEKPLMIKESRHRQRLMLITSRHGCIRGGDIIADKLYLEGMQVETESSSEHYLNAKRRKRRIKSLSFYTRARRLYTNVGKL